MHFHRCPSIFIYVHTDIRSRRSYHIIRSPILQLHKTKNLAFSSNSYSDMQQPRPKCRGSSLLLRLVRSRTQAKCLVPTLADTTQALLSATSYNVVRVTSLQSGRTAAAFRHVRPPRTLQRVTALTGMPNTIGQVHRPGRKYRPCRAVTVTYRDNQAFSWSSAPIAKLEITSLPTPTLSVPLAYSTASLVVLPKPPFQPSSHFHLPIAVNHCNGMPTCNIT